MAEIIDGKLVSGELKAKYKNEIQELISVGIVPGLAVVLVGDNPASRVYVRNKHKACLDVGINSYQIELPEDTPEDVLLKKIDELNADKNVHGILVQLPLPKHISEEKVITRISPEKDVDAFSPINVGKITLGKYDFLPCTPAGIMQMLQYYGVTIRGKECVVIGRSNIVGKPLALLMLSEDATVTICHSKTQNLQEITKRADILVAAIGKAGFVKKNMVKPGAVVIDVGINRNEEGKLTGDVDFNEVSQIASMITPVPGGVGPMTITMLLKNTITAAKLQNKV
jgi:methylenetetrahydrofolate dehydrogenase (NADP+)/methenyltetrahydrofolate cyclohydrolase